MRARLRFVKLGKVRWTSHRDVARMWERALRRASLPVAYTQGFSPRPKLSFGLALSTGHESLAEYLDVELTVAPDAEPPEPSSLPDRLSPHLPTGIDVVAAGVVTSADGSLQESVESTSWEIEVRGLDAHEAEPLVQAALAADELVLTRHRKGREVTDDLRPAVRSVAVAGPTAAGVELHAELAVHPRSVRPAELLLALAPGRGLEEGRVVRTAQWIWRDGTREEPLPWSGDLAAAARPHAEVRAS